MRANIETDIISWVVSFACQYFKWYNSLPGIDPGLKNIKTEEATVILEIQY